MIQNCLQERSRHTCKQAHLSSSLPTTPHFPPTQGIMIHCRPTPKHIAACTLMRQVPIYNNATATHFPDRPLTQAMPPQMHSPYHPPPIIISTPPATHNDHPQTQCQPMTPQQQHPHCNPQWPHHQHNAKCSTLSNPNPTNGFPIPLTHNAHLHPNCNPQWPPTITMKTNPATPTNDPTTSTPTLQPTIAPPQAQCNTIPNPQQPNLTTTPTPTPEPPNPLLTPPT